MNTSIENQSKKTIKNPFDLKCLHQLVLRSYIGPLVLTFFISLFILLMQFLWKYIDDLVGKGLEWNIIMELLMYASAGLVPMALPLAILLSSLMTFGNMGENFELLAIKSSGISLQRIMKPLIILIIFISIGAFFFSNEVLPYTNLKTGSLLYDISHQRPELNIKIGVFNNDIDNYSIKITEKNKKTNMLYGLMIYDHSTNRGNTNVTVADSGTIVVTDNKEYMVISLFNGYRYEELLDDGKNKLRKFPHRRDAFQKQTSILRLSNYELNRTDDDLFKHHYQMLPIEALEKAIDSLEGAYDITKQRIGKNLLRANYLKREMKNIFYDDSIANTSTWLSIVPPDSAVISDLDSIFNSLSRSRQTKIIASAMDFARSSKRVIEGSKDDLHSRLRWIKRHQIEWHRKFSLSFACLVFFFIGAPLGAIIRKGGLGMPVVVSVLFFIIYYIISLSGEKFVREDILPAVQGMWISSVVLLPLGIFLTYKATTDSVILNIDTYINFYKKIPFLKRFFKEIEN